MDNGYNFFLDLISIGGLHTFKVVGVPLGDPGTKCHLDVGPVASHRMYYKGEGGGFPQVWAVVSLVNLSLLADRPNTKSALAMH